jgi:putative flippase GtrA
MTRHRIVRYAMVGVLVAATYVGLAALLRMTTPLSAPLASAIAFACAVVVQYVAHSRYTFGVEATNWLQAARFVTTVGLGFVLSTAFVGWLAPRWGICELCALLVVVIVLPIVNYLIFLLWVFAGFRER